MFIEDDVCLAEQVVWFEARNSKYYILCIMLNIHFNIHLLFLQNVYIRTYIHKLAYLYVYPNIVIVLIIMFMIIIIFV